jgi:TolB-like protein
MSFFEELKRRNVFRVGAAYVVVAWLILQVADVVLNNIEMPAWIFHLILLLLAIGFPVTLLLAWAYELTPDGIKKETDIAASASVSRQTGHKLNYVIIGALVVAVIYLVVFRGWIEVDGQVSLQTLIARPAVIVLPFENTSGDENQDYLAFGLTDELIAGLQHTRDFPVVSRNASLEYRDSDLSANEYANSLGASYRVEGSVSSDSDGIRVLATLSGTGDNQVWAERFQRVAGQVELFEVADELVAKIAAAVLQSEVRRVQRTDRPPADAWEHYVRGLSVVLAFDPDKYENARRQLDQAVEIAPNMAEAWWAIGELEINNYLSQPLLKETDLEHLHTIISYFRKSHELSPFHAAACGCLGYVLTSVGQHDEALAVYKQALEANPLSARLRVDYALFLLWDGRYEGAIENANLALKLGAFSIDRAFVWLIRSNVALAQDNPAEALEAVNRAIFISKDPFTMPTAVALLYVLGKQTDAKRLLDEMQQSFPGISPQNPLLYVMLKPIDDILALQRERGEVNGPADVNEIYRLLNKIEP